VKAWKIAFVTLTIAGVAWLGSFLIVRATCAPGPGARASVYGFAPLCPYVLVAYETDGRPTLRGVLVYFGSNLRSAQWFNAANELISDQQFSPGCVSSTGPEFVDRGDGVFVPPPGSDMEWRGSSGGMLESNEWWYDKRFVYREQTVSLSTLPLMGWSFLAGVVASAIVFWPTLVRRLRQPRITDD
jgi:hypothetical protein